MPDWSTLLAELNEHEPSFQLVAEARRRAAGGSAPSPDRRWVRHGRLAAAVIVTAALTVTVIIVLAIAARSHSATEPAAPNSPTPRPPRSVLVSQAESLYVQTILALSRPGYVFGSEAPPEFAQLHQQARTQINRLGEGDPLRPLITQIDQVLTTRRPRQITTYGNDLSNALGPLMIYLDEHAAEVPRLPPIALVAAEIDALTRYNHAIYETARDVTTPSRDRARQLQEQVNLARLVVGLTGMEIAKPHRYHPWIRTNAWKRVQELYSTLHEASTHADGHRYEKILSTLHQLRPALAQWHAPR
jgi:hypothetical protein